MGLKKRIFRSMIAAIMAAVGLLCALFVYQLFHYTDAQARGGLQSTRITIIDPTGAVTYDNHASAETMDNHLTRLEVSEAFESGFGHSVRYSDTLDRKTYYFATRMTDGNVIRLSVTTNSVFSLLAQMLPILIFIIAVIFIFSIFLSRRLAKNIIAPIKAAGGSGNPEESYDELSPFLRRINAQEKQLSQQLLDLDSRELTMKAITDNMKEGLILLDEKGSVLSANRSALSVFSGDSECVGKNILELTRSTQIFEGVKSVLQGEHSDFVADFADGVYHIFLSPVESGGAILLMLDITAKAKAEKLRREFSANVSHELKTPLTTISGYAELINSGMAQDGDVGTFAGKIKTEAARMLALIEDIIRLSQLDEALGERQTERVNFTEQAESVVFRLRHAADEKDVTLLVTGENVYGNVNRQMLDELLFNLVDNGIKYNKPGGKVTVEVAAEGGGACVCVSDTGIGIPAEHLDKVFERFYRVDKSRSKKTGGTGLGLSIVRHIAEYHGGRIEIESKVGYGTRIVIHLP